MKLGSSFDEILRHELRVLTFRFPSAYLSFSVVMSNSNSRSAKLLRSRNVICMNDVTEISVQGPPSYVLKFLFIRLTEWQISVQVSSPCIQSLMGTSS